MLKTTSVLKVDAYDVAKLMNHVYGIDEEDALEAIFGEGGTFDGAAKFITAARDGGMEALACDDIGYPGKSGRYTTRTMVFADLCNRGEVEPGEYVVVYSC